MLAPRPRQASRVGSETGLGANMAPRDGIEMPTSVIARDPRFRAGARSLA